MCCQPYGRAPTQHIRVGCGRTAAQRGPRRRRKPNQPTLAKLNLVAAALGQRWYTLPDLAFGRRLPCRLFGDSRHEGLEERGGDVSVATKQGPREVSSTLPPHPSSGALPADPIRAVLRNDLRRSSVGASITLWTYCNFWRTFFHQEMTLIFVYFKGGHLCFA
jgi:hypothetical protein